MDLIQTPHARLSPGMILDAPQEFDDFLLELGGDTESRAEFLLDDAGRPVLRVGGYMTMDGTVIPECVWTITEISVHAGRRLLRLGTPLP
jgi:hypothetical protein